MSFGRLGGLGHGFGRGGSGGNATASPIIQLNASSIAENASVGDLIALISTANKPGNWGTSTYTITLDADSKFVLDGVDNTRLELEASLDYETATSHTVQITDTPSGPYSPIARVFTISVTDIFEAPPGGDYAPTYHIYGF